MKNTSKRYLYSALLLSILAGAGCAVNPGHESPEEAALLDEQFAAVSPSTEDLLFLTDEVRVALDEQIDDSWTKNRKFTRLQRYLFDESEKDIHYEANRTGTAMETWLAGEGNCLAITNLFVAAARYVGLDSNFKTVAVRPTWAQAEKTLIRYEHIVAVGRLDARDEYIVDLLPNYTASGRNSRVIPDDHALALYHSNLGAEFVVAGNYPEAIDQILKSLLLWPDHSDAWNNLGAAYKRNGDYKLAELSYKRALRYDRLNYSALANLTQFYLAMGTPG